MVSATDCQGLRPNGVTLAPVPLGDERRDPALLDKPARELTRAMGRVGDEPLRSQEDFDDVAGVLGAMVPTCSLPSLSRALSLTGRPAHSFAAILFIMMIGAGLIKNTMSGGSDTDIIKWATLLNPRLEGWCVCYARPDFIGWGTRIRT